MSWALSSTQLQHIDTFAASEYNISRVLFLMWSRTINSTDCYRQLDNKTRIRFDAQRTGLSWTYQTLTWLFVSHQDILLLDPVLLLCMSLQIFLTRVHANRHQQQTDRCKFSIFTASTFGRRHHSVISTGLCGVWTLTACLLFVCGTRHAKSFVRDSEHHWAAALSAFNVRNYDYSLFFDVI